MLLTMLNLEELPGQLSKDNACDMFLSRNRQERKKDK